MLGRKKIEYMKKIPPDVINTLRRSKSDFRPTKEIVKEYLSNPSDEAWCEYERKYLKIIEKRFHEDRTQFDTTASRAMKEDVYLGCFYHTKKNPDVYKCHTILTLKFMKQKYPKLQVVFPEPTV